MVAPLQRGFDLPAEKIIPGVYPVMMSNGIGAYHNEYKVKGPGVVTGRSGTIGNLQYVESAFWPHNTTLWVTKFYGNHPKFMVVPEKLRTLDRGRPWRDSQFASTRLSPSRDMSR